MKSHELEAELNIKLKQCEQYYQPLEQYISIYDREGVLDIPETSKRAFEVSLFTLVQIIEDIDNLLKKITLDEPVQSISTSMREFYRNEIIPNKAKIDKLFVYLVGLADIEFNADEIEAKSSNTVWSILATGLDYWSIAETGEFSDDEIAEADRLLFSEFFTPDGWLKNADEIGPILGKSANQKIPGKVRMRLKELYRSFILGNYLSAIALSRSILEYALIDKANKLGVNIYSNDPKHPDRIIKLSWLVDYASETEILSDLKDKMKSVVEAGNRTLHPRKKNDLVLLPPALRQTALDSINAVRECVETLYL